MSYFDEKLTAAQEFITKPAADVTTSGTISNLANSGTSYIRLTAGTTLSSIVAAGGGKELTLVNANTVDLVVENENTGETAANRIVTGTGSNYTMPTSSQIVLKYDESASRWRAVSAPTAVVFPDQSQDVGNLSIDATVAANALTIAFKTKALANASASSPIRIGFRSATNATGDYSIQTVTGALSTVISSGSTLGHVALVNEPIYVYALNNAGTVEIAYSTTLFDDTINQSTTAEGGAGAADSRTVLYSTTARSNVAIRLVGKLVVNNATPGTWSSAPGQIKVLPVPDLLARFVAGSIGGTPAPAGYIGETITATLTTGFQVIGPTLNVYSDVTGFGTITLTEGNWQIRLNVSHAEISFNTGALSSVVGAVALRSGSTTVEAISAFGVVSDTSYFRAINGASICLNKTITTSTTFKVSMIGYARSGTSTINDMQMNGAAMGSTGDTTCYLTATRIG
jgi:hypothetical protein